MAEELNRAARIVACPNCGKSVKWTPESRWRPFCSERCRIADLGAWANETYRIPVAGGEDPSVPEESGGPR